MCMERGFAKKAVLLGLDSAVPGFVERFACEGKLPSIRRLIEGGVFAEAIGAIPTLTGPNWPTIATGAWPRTHGVTDMWVHIPGEPLDRVHSGFLTTYCRAEHLWDAAERVGKRSIILKYACAVPRTVNLGVQVDGYATPWWGSNLFEICPCRCFSIQPLPGATSVRLSVAGGWSNAPRSYSKPLETTFSFSPARGKGGVTFHGLVIDSAGRGYDLLIISKSKDASELVARLSVGEWSSWLKSEFEAIQGHPVYLTQSLGLLDAGGGKLLPTYDLKPELARRVEGAFRFKLIELSKDASSFRLYLSQVYPTRGYTYPDDVSDELLASVGPFQEHIGPYPLYSGWIDEESYLEEMSYQADWLGKAGVHLMSRHKWDLFFLQWHGCNHAQHSFWAGIDPISPWYKPSEAERYWKIFSRFYGMADRMVGRIAEGADEDTLIVVVSDHGHIPLIKGEILIANVLARAGLLSFKRTNGSVAVDWSRTRAFPQRNVHIYVNLKDRDPDGIVEPGKEYEEVRDKIISTLYGLKDRDGNSPIYLALKREDAEMLGLGGERSGDVIYQMAAGYHGDPSTVTVDLEPFSYGKTGARTMADDVGLARKPTSVHGQHLSTTRLGLGSIRSTFIMFGPRVRRGCKLLTQVRLVDVAPTIAFALGIPVPAQSEGRVLLEAFEGV